AHWWRASVTHVCGGQRVDQTISHTHTLSHTHMNSLPDTHEHTYTHTHTHAHTHTHTHTHTRTRTHTHTHTHTPTPTVIHKLFCIVEQFINLSHSLSVQSISGAHTLSQQSHL